MKLWTDEETQPFLTPWRQATVLRWYDADTPTLRIDLGFDIDGIKTPVRLLAEGAVTTPDDKTDDSVDAWEMRGREREQGKLAKARVLELIPVGSTIRIWSKKGRGNKGKYGRWLCVILFPVRKKMVPPADLKLSLKEAKAKDNCRVCDEPSSAPFALNFGDEYSHERCLVVSYVPERHDEKQRCGWRSLGDVLLEEGHADRPGY